MTERPDLLTQLERYGTVLDAAADDGADLGCPITQTEGPFAVRPSPRRQRRRAVLVAAVAIVLLAGALVLVRDRSEVNTSRFGDGGPTGVDPAGPAMSPRLVAGTLPAGLVPTAALEGTGSGITSSDGRPQSQSTVQVFRLSAGPDTPLSVTVVISGAEDRPQPPTALPDTVRGTHVQGTALGAGFGGVEWWPARTVALALAADALPRSELRAVVEAFRARGDDPLTGFDAPVGPVGRWTVSLVAEHVVARDTPWPAASRVWYGDRAAPARNAVVEAYGPVPGASREILSAGPTAGWRSIAGEQRLVVPPGPMIGWENLWTMVAWVRPDGTQVVLKTRDLDDGEIETLVGGIDAAEPATWERTIAQAGDALRAEREAASADLPIGRVAVYGDGSYHSDERNPGPRLRGACLTVPGAAPRCTAIAPTVGLLQAPNLYGAGGPLAAALQVTYAAHYVTSLTVDGQWYGIGSLWNASEVSVTAGGSAVEVGTSRRDGGTVFGAQLPTSAERAELRAQVNLNITMPPGTPNIGPAPVRVTLARPPRR